jgi:hypothetical protein
VPTTKREVETEEESLIRREDLNWHHGVPGSWPPDPTVASARARRELVYGLDHVLVASERNVYRALYAIFAMLLT